MEVKIHEVLPEINRRTDKGRVVISPPTANGGLKPRMTGSLMMCCNRAFLTDDSYRKHLADKTEHSKPVDPSKFPKVSYLECMPKMPYDLTSREFWIVRKKGTTLKMWEEFDDDATDDLKNVTVTDVDNSVTGRGNWKKCEICNLSVMGCNMRRHKQVCHSGGQYKCPHCCCTFHKYKSRKTHQYKMHRVQRLPANSRKKAILARAKQQLVSLKSSKSRKKSQECPICRKVFHDGLNFRDHLNTHSGKRPYKCNVCGSAFNHNQNLRRHLRVAHPENSKHFCKICNVGFSGPISLGAHRRSVHSNKQEKAKSPKLKKITPILNPTLQTTPNTVLPQLKLQYPSPNKSKMFECNICHKQLATSQTWRGHMLIHQNLKPYKCKLCGTYFRLHGTMTNHLKVAHSNGSFRCKQCSCQYNVKRALDRHIRQYHSTRIKENGLETKVKTSGSDNNSQSIVENTNGISPNFKCDLCGMRTNEQNLYKDHLLLHSEVGKRQCDLCLKVFSGSIHVKLHKKAAHGKGLYKCPFCCCRYLQNQGLIKHLTNEHGMERGEWNYKTRKLIPEGRKRIQSNLIQTSSLKRQSENDNDKQDIQEYEESQPEVTGVERKYACNLCQKRFIWKGSVFNHKKSAHGIGRKSSNVVADSPRRSNRTSDVDSNSIEMQQELILKSQPTASPEKIEKKYECDLCSLLFVTPASVSNHKKKAHFHKGTFKCTECSCRFTGSQGLFVHRAQAHGYVGVRRRKLGIQSSNANSAGTNNNTSTKRDRSIKKFYCNKCGKFIIGRIAYRAHVISHTSTNTYDCDLCQAKFLHRSSVLNHKKKSHFHDGEVHCSKCSCKFVTVGGLTNHLKHFHKPVGRKTVLTKKSTSAVMPNSKSPIVKYNGIDSSKQSDVNDEVSEKPSTTDTDKNVEVHVETYDRNQDKQFACNICNAKFQHRGSILKHKKTAHFHNGTYKCPECICKFLTPNSLVLHRKNQHEVNMGELKMLVVSKPSDPKLSTFNKAKKVLKNSLNRRRDHEPWVCDICDITLSRKAYLKTHKQAAHSNGKHRCSKCCCTFHTRVGLAKHRLHHEDGSKKQIERDDRDSEIIESNEDQTESCVPVEENSSSSYSPTSKVNRNFLKIRGSALSSKRHSSSTLTDSPVKVSSAEPANSNEKTESVYASKPPRGSVSASAYRFKCTLCPIRFTHSTYVERHVKKAHTNGSVHCTFCSCTFHSNIALAAHKRVYHNSSIPGAVNIKDKDYEVFPPQTSTDSSQSPDSTKIGKPSQNFVSLSRMSGVRVKCKMCSIMFSGQRQLKRHMKQAHTDGSFRCGKCSCTFLNNYALSAHKRVHHNPLTHGKGIYNSFSAKKKSFKVKSTTNGSRTKPVETKKSTEVSQTDIITTNRTSTRIRDKMENNIDNHSVQDTSNPENGTSTLLSGSTDNEATSDITHTPKKVSFKKPQNDLVKRKRVRKPDDRRFPCSFCPKVFASPGSFSRHVKCHTRPEVCTQCSMRFRTRDEVAKHVSTSHGDGIHSCFVCSCRFTTPNGLNMHMKLIHERHSASYDDIVIEQDEDMADSDSVLNGFLPSSYSQSMQDDQDDLIEDSVPIIDGMIEATYSIATNQMFYREIPTVNHNAYNGSYSTNDENYVDESEPIIQGILTFNSHLPVQQASFQPPPPQQKRKAFSPKSRPMKCSTCGATCYGPEKLRQHMESHMEGDPLTLSNGAEIETVQCSKCNVEFAAMSDLMEHLQVDHDPTGLYKCVYCPCSMREESALQSHFMKYHSRG